MAKIAFIGLGNMGGPMLRNLLKAGHECVAFDLSAPALAAAEQAGARPAASPGDAARGVDGVITMLPAGTIVRAVYEGPGGVIANAAPGTLLIDCSTIDVASARAVAEAATAAGLSMVDAPVSGGVAGAAAATLTFMVGGPPETFEAARPILAAMGGTIVHAGAAGTGQAAKICNNMLLGISMIGTCEAFMLAKRLGLDAQKLFDISSKASGQCWSLTSYCPVPGPVASAPSNRDYQPGFAAAMMLKDLKLAQEAAAGVDAATPLGAAAAALYSLYCNAGHAGTDFSGIIAMIDGSD
ncbi:3-hydroxyisobutyrate dehydrogenase [Rhodospirillum rubrum]|uniref:3-hydroxyisobutyrate dehydrogenase n=1 Tax=Rhodospirillum rubrum (strain ATCC 11170 / ATH 1.1.1 / DSM 467 / LMG 4362 / NCIMB 8255 / S1) TaxID=269796 RepID=Q2RTB2_RHORT|nr:3-hydroxyisobutyrate dehydrogenase [Rhodospirillum rubrum]ABC22633.1 3-hydroxyisobutyrate dehydrogenase [Rhodospirillum rubrum ATCC 11170]AEO48351.1 3-hydroxyisobutyrate dehydrogenase [Rhodospirillum rubrum F11]MBK5954230.1 3-hydroxyisobutyrate dehydrogenase [Rhodospirillum rubrum]QXG82255.1 3-hydroxyisobutyrate dehydrogenase [Rhodospirillum rubrum]HAP99189.1 3-hydroxyisobutyrate dehydrogenase [Rhodospirillum rubrum]